ncbi:unnamed protein product [Caretta caretta]
MAAHTSVLVRATALGTVLVAGDLFEQEQDEAAWPALSEDPTQQEWSRRRALALADVVIPGHGPPFQVLRVEGSPVGEGRQGASKTNQGEEHIKNQEYLNMSSEGSSGISSSDQPEAQIQLPTEETVSPKPKGIS